MEIRIQKSSHPTLLVNFMRPNSLATTVTRDIASKDQMMALMVDPRFWSPLAGGVIVAYEPTFWVPAKYPERLAVTPRLAEGLQFSCKVVLT